MRSKFTARSTPNLSLFPILVVLEATSSTNRGYLGGDSTHNRYSITYDDIFGGCPSSETGCGGASSFQRKRWNEKSNGEGKERDREEGGDVGDKIVNSGIPICLVAMPYSVFSISSSSYLAMRPRRLVVWILQDPRVEPKTKSKRLGWRGTRLPLESSVSLADHTWKTSAFHSTFTSAGIKEWMALVYSAVWRNLILELAGFFSRTN